MASIKEKAIWRAYWSSMKGVNKHKNIWEIKYFGFSKVLWFPTSGYYKNVISHGGVLLWTESWLKGYADE